MLAYYKLLQKTLIACSYDDAFTSEGGILANDSGGNGEGRDVTWFGIKEQLYSLLSIVRRERISCCWDDLGYTDQKTGGKIRK